jgi:hypothetical protein
MNSFKTYLTEVEEKNKYKFLIKLAGDLPLYCDERLKNILEKYKVSSFKKVEAAPVQASPLDFPELENVRITAYNIELCYPVTPLELQALIAEHTKIHMANVKVHTDHDEELLKVTAPCDKTKEGQQLVGDAHVSDFLKELQKTRADHQPVQYTGVNDQILATKCPTGD